MVAPVLHQELRVPCRSTRSADLLCPIARMDVTCMILAGVALLGAVSDAKTDDLKICVIGQTKYKATQTSKYCDLLARSKRTPVSCVFAADRLDCLRAVSRRKADFTVLEAEDLYFSTLWEDSGVLVVSEVRSLKALSFEFGAVVVVRNSLNISSVDDLKGSRLCHPGMARGTDRSPLFAQYFEERVAPPNCDDSLPVNEDRIRTTSEYFGAACKAGPWVPNATDDRILKNEYSNLCALCDNPGRCSLSDKYWGPAGSLICLKDGVGDVAWARFDDVRLHFKLTIGNPLPSVSEYSFLCEDGKLMPLTEKTPCFWLARPWQVIAANRKSATEVQKVLDHMSDDDLTDWETNLMHVIESFMEYIQNLIVSKTPEDYLKSITGYLSASAMSESNCKPKRSVRICTTSATEQKKCVWMAMAARAFTIQPYIVCIQKSSVDGCLTALQLGYVDVFVAKPDVASVALRKVGVMALVFEAPKDLKDAYLLSTVVRANSGMSTTQDISGKKACFTRPGGVGWNAVLSGLQKQGYVSSFCGGKDSLLNMFQDICVVRDSSEEIPQCCTGNDLSPKEDIDALRCLDRGGCDVAFINLGWTEAVNSSEYRIICQGGDADCFWAWSYPGHILVQSDMPEKKRSEILGVFAQLSQYFGRATKNGNHMLEIFGPFNNISNVLFQDSSASFVTSPVWSQPQYYETIATKVALCSGCCPLTYQTLQILIVAIATSAFVT